MTSSPGEPGQPVHGRPDERVERVERTDPDVHHTLGKRSGSGRADRDSGVVCCPSQAGSST